LELGYEGISGMRGDGILVLDFDRIIWQQLLELDWFVFRFTKGT
jgi:hypothetical protein